MQVMHTQVQHTQPLHTQHQHLKPMQLVSFKNSDSEFPRFCPFKFLDIEKTNIVHIPLAALATASYATTAYAAPALKTYAARKFHFFDFKVSFLPISIN